MQSENSVFDYLDEYTEHIDIANWLDSSDNEIHRIADPLLNKFKEYYK